MTCSRTIVFQALDVSLNHLVLVKNSVSWTHLQRFLDSKCRVAAISAVLTASAVIVTQGILEMHLEKRLSRRQCDSKALESDLS